MNSKVGEPLCDQHQVVSEKNVHLVISLEGDELAATNNPQKMVDNYRIPIQYLVKHGHGKKFATDYGPKDELIVSPGFARALKDENLRKLIESTETMKPKEILSSKVRRETIKRALVRTVQLEFRRVKVPVIIRKPYKRKNRKSLEKGVAKRKERKAKAVLKSRCPKTKTTTGRIPSNLDDLEVARILNRSYSIHLGSLKCLAPKQYLNDEIMDYAMYDTLMTTRPLPDTVYVGIYGWTAYFFQDMESSIPQRAIESLYKLLTEKRSAIELLSKQYLVIPIQREKHWFLGIVCQPFPTPSIVKEVDELKTQQRIADPRQDLSSNFLYSRWVSEQSPVILIFDSMTKRLRSQCSNLDKFHADTADYIRRGLIVMHDTFWKKTNKDYVIPDFATTPASIPYHLMNVPQQDNEEDCGIFCMAYVYYWFEELKKNVSHSQLSHRNVYPQNFSNWFQNEIGCLRHKLFKKIKDHCRDNYPSHFPHVDALEKKLFPSVSMST